MELTSGKTGIRSPSPVEHMMLVSLFARQPLSRIPLIDLRNALRIYGVSFSRDAEQVDPNIPALALLALREIQRRLYYH